MGLVSRVVEDAGIPTVTVSTGRDITAAVMPPRALFVNHPMGNPFGRPGEIARQREILLAALHMVEDCKTPGELRDLDTDWGEPVKTLYDLEFGFKMGAPDPTTGKQRF